jgi:cysteinyl-tRNA synthetase
LSFSWEALSAAQTGLYRLWEGIAELCEVEATGESGGAESLAFQRQFHEAINRDLDTSVALSVVHAVLGSKLPARDKLALFQDFDRVLALDLLPMARGLSATTDAEKALLAQRDAARKSKNWALSDQLRENLRDLGVDVKDTPAGQRTVRRDLLTLFRDDDRQDEPG